MSGSGSGSISRYMCSSSHSSSSSSSACWPACQLTSMSRLQLQRCQVVAQAGGGIGGRAGAAGADEHAQQRNEPTDPVPNGAPPGQASDVGSGGLVNPPDMRAGDSDNGGMRRRGVLLGALFQTVQARVVAWQAPGHHMAGLCRCMAGPDCCMAGRSCRMAGAGQAQALAWQAQVVAWLASLSHAGPGRCMPGPGRRMVSPHLRLRDRRVARLALAAAATQSERSDAYGIGPGVGEGGRGDGLSCLPGSAAHTYVPVPAHLQPSAAPT
eukprot:360359-Chlamydomonas_euryale.AAC.11